MVLVVKNPPANAGDIRDVCKMFDPLVGKIPWSRKWQPTPVFLPGKLHGQRSLVVYSPWGCKELHMTECAHTHTFTHIHIYGKVTFLGFWFNNSYSGNQVESPH